MRNSNLFFSGKRSILALQLGQSWIDNLCGYGEHKANIHIASAIRFQVESALAWKIPSALTPQPKVVRPVMETGIRPLDDLLGGGLSVGTVSELIGAECSGRTSVALSFLARITTANKVCAWIADDEPRPNC